MSECKVIDCHCHVYPDNIAPKAVSGISEFYDLEETEDLKSRGTVANMQQREHAAGIYHQIIFSVATTPHQVKSINRFIANAVSGSEKNLTGLGTVHPDSPDIKQDIDEIINLGLKGIKIHPDFQQIAADDLRFFKVYEYCEGRLPLLIHCGDYRKNYSNPENIAPILENFPCLTVVGAHLGGWSVWDEAVKVLPYYNNFFVDCSSSLQYLKPERALEIIRSYGAEKVMFGTDYPLWDPEESYKSFLSLNLTEEEKEQITHLTAEKIFGIEC